MSKIVRRHAGRFDDAKGRALLAVETAAEQAAKLVQAEVVARVPVRTGNAKAWLASPEALGKLRKAGGWRFGLITPDLRKNAHYLIFVEYGTKGYTRGQTRTYTSKGGKVRTKKVARTVPARPAHPFFRPGVDAARGKVKTMITQAMADALKD
jgi:HK97 gp10 family phage protein